MLTTVCTLLKTKVMCNAAAIILEIIKQTNKKYTMKHTVNIFNNFREKAFSLITYHR